MFSSVHKRWAWRDNRSNRRRQIQTRLANFSFNWERERCVRNTTGSGRCWLFNSLFCFIKLSLSCQVSSVQQASELFIDIQIACFFRIWISCLSCLSFCLSFRFRIWRTRRSQKLESAISVGMKWIIQMATRSIWSMIRITGEFEFGIGAPVSWTDSSPIAAICCRV